MAQPGTLGPTAPPTRHTMWGLLKSTSQPQLPLSFARPTLSRAFWTIHPLTDLVEAVKQTRLGKNPFPFAPTRIIHWVVTYPLRTTFVPLLQPSPPPPHFALHWPRTVGRQREIPITRAQPGTLEPTTPLNLCIFSVCVLVFGFWFRILCAERQFCNNLPTHEACIDLKH